MNAMKKSLCLSVALSALLVGACTNTQGASEAPVFLTVDIALQPGFVNVGVIAPVQINTININSHFKNPQQSDPQHFADVELNSYLVHFRRTDGGTVVPPDQTFGA